MKKSTIIGIIFTILTGSLLHFVYEWTGNHLITSFFSPVNESTWEHLKLLFFPYLVYMIFEYFYIGKEYPNYITAKTIGLLAGLVAIPVIFYAYTSILGTNYLALDILTFVLGVLISYLVSYYLLIKGVPSFNILSAVVLVGLLAAFFVFTFYPPHIQLFLDPVTKTYGALEQYSNHL